MIPELVGSICVTCDESDLGSIRVRVSENLAPLVGKSGYANDLVLFDIGQQHGTPPIVTFTISPFAGPSYRETLEALFGVAHPLYLHHRVLADTKLQTLSLIATNAPRGRPYHRI